MADYANDELGVQFSVADRITVRRQLAYTSTLPPMLLPSGQPNPASEEGRWLAAVPLLENWKCDAISNPAQLDLDAVTDIRVRNILRWVGMRVMMHLADLDNLPKALSSAPSPS